MSDEEDPGLCYIHRVVKGPKWTAEEEADIDRAIKWANETIPSWKNTFDLIRSIRREERARPPPPPPEKQTPEV